MGTLKNIYDCCLYLIDMYLSQKEWTGDDVQTEEIVFPKLQQKASQHGNFGS